jgi:DNA-binding response OmpR family regulator
LNSSKPSKNDGKLPVHILLADNDELFIRGPLRTLTDRGWKVTTAASLDEASEALQNGWFHVAILDLRLKDDADNHDRSGLDLATQPRFSPVPKIIYTTFVDGAQKEAHALAEPLLLVSKQEPRSKLVEAVQTALNRTQTNWNARVVFSPATGLNFQDLAHTISATETANSETEAMDLLRRLFYNEPSRVTVERVLWSNGRRLALEISTPAPVAGREFYIVVLGSREAIEAEVALVRKVGPKAQGGNSTYLNHSALTTHFGAIAYAIYTPKADVVTNLHAAYKAPREFQAAVRGLFDTTLPPWHREDSSLQEEPLSELYRWRLLGNVSMDKLRGIVGGLARESGRVKFPLRLEGGRLYLPGESAAVCGDPLARLIAWPDAIESWVTASPGRLTGENVLVDQSGRAWCTDFAQAGAAPVLANHVAVEAMIRFDWVECAEMRELLEVERRLTGTNDFRQVDSAAVDREGRTALQAIREVRQLAALMPNFDVNSYQAGIYYEAISRVAKFDPGEPLTLKELRTLLHALVAAALIVRPDRGAASPGVEIDGTNRVVRVNGRAVPLPKLQFNLLLFLHSRKPNLCRYEQIFQEVYQETYRHDASVRSQNVKLSKAIASLCNAIGEDWIENVRGAGYRFNG